MNIPKARNTFCKRCRSHKPHKVSQYKKGKDSIFAQGKRRYDRKQSGYGGQTKPIFHKKVCLIFRLSRLLVVVFRPKLPRKLYSVLNAQCASTRTKLPSSAANTLNLAATRRQRYTFCTSADACLSFVSPRELLLTFKCCRLSLFDC